MKKFALLRDYRVTHDIQKGIDYYNEKNGTGKRFFKAVNTTIKNLSLQPFYQIRYKNIRCKPIKKFPYMIHFSVDEKTKIIIVHAVICTYKNPDEQWL